MRPEVVSNGKNGLTLTHPLSLAHFHLEWKDGSRNMEDVVAGKIVLCFGVGIVLANMYTDVTIT